MPHFRSKFPKLAKFTLLLPALAALHVTASAAHQQPQTRETPAQAVARALSEHGSQWASGRIADWTAEGTLTMFSVEGPKGTFDMTLMRKGAQVQRIIKEATAEIRQGSDGSQSWNSLGGSFVPTAQGYTFRFLESQTARSIQKLFEDASQLQLHDVDTNSKEHVIEAQDKEGRKTKYFIDASTSAITKLEFVTGQSTDPF